MLERFAGYDRFPYNIARIPDGWLVSRLLARTGRFFRDIKYLSPPARHFWATARIALPRNSQKVTARDALRCEGACAHRLSRLWQSNYWPSRNWDFRRLRLRRCLAINGGLFFRSWKRRARAFAP